MTGSLWNLPGSLLTCALLLVAGCADTDTLGDELGAPGASGNPSGGSGGSGVSTAGTATGGTGDAGTDAGGTSTGGTDTAGTSTGGTGAGGTGAGGTGAGGSGAFQCTMTEVFGANAPPTCDPCIIANCCEESEACFLDAACSALNTCQANAGPDCSDEAIAKGWGQAEFDQCVQSACIAESTPDAQSRIDGVYACIQTLCYAQCYP